LRITVASSEPRGGGSPSIVGLSSGIAHFEATGIAAQRSSGQSYLIPTA
jgi:hypothetical protein